MEISKTILQGIIQQLQSYLKRRKFVVETETITKNQTILTKGATEIVFTNLGEQCILNSSIVLNTGGTFGIDSNQNEINAVQSYKAFWQPSATNKKLIVVRKIYI